MEDETIIALYWHRSQQAIAETKKKYGSKLTGLAQRILSCLEDAEECVSDTYLTAWNTIPPQKPVYFFAYLAQITRRFAFGRLDYRRADKRNGRLVELGQELEECLPGSVSAEDRVEQKQIIQAINRFLRSLPEEKQLLFLRRYWYADSIAQLSKTFHQSESKVKSTLFRIRKKLKEALEQEGVLE